MAPKSNNLEKPFFSSERALERDINEEEMKLNSKIRPNKQSKSAFKKIINSTYNINKVVPMNS